MSAYDNIKLDQSETYSAEVFYRNFEDEPIRYHWEILYESNDLGVGGDYESRPDSIDGLIQNDNTHKVKITAPKEKGAYRLFVYVIDSENKTATANIPFYVK